MKKFISIFLFFTVIIGCENSLTPEDFIMDTEPTLKSTHLNIVIPDDFPSIQEAMKYATDGDIIRVKQGNYNGRVLIRNLKNITLIGEDAIVSSGFSNNFLILNCKNFRIQGFIVDGENAKRPAEGIIVRNSSGFITNNKFQKCGRSGISVYSGDVSINFNEFSYAKTGITAYDQAKTKVFNNKFIAEKSGNVGIYKEGTASIFNNEFNAQNSTQPSTSAIVLRNRQFVDIINAHIIHNKISNYNYGIEVVVIDGNNGEHIENSKLINNIFENVGQNLWLVNTQDELKIHPDF